MATGLLIAGAAISAGSAIAQGIGAKKAADEQAAIQEQEATFATAQSRDVAGQVREEGESFLSSQTAGFGASGVRLDEGSPLAVMQESAANLEQDVQRTLKSGEFQSTRLRNLAASTRTQGKFALAGGILSGGSTFLTGFGQSGLF